MLHRKTSDRLRLDGRAERKELAPKVELIRHSADAVRAAIVTENRGIVMNKDGKPLTQMEKIQIMMQEYSSVRTEVLDQSKIMHQVFGAGGTVAVPLLALIFSNGTKLSTYVGLFLLVVLILLMYVIARMMTFVARETNARLLEIESEVNRLGKSKLVAWETEHGMGTGSDKRRIDTIFEPLLPLARVLRKLLISN